jgi:flagellar assembly protein FliH
VAGIEHMTPAKKFLFDHIFDATLPLEEQAGEDEMSTEAVANENGPPDTFSEDELARAHAQGLAEGREQAGAEAAVTVERRVADALDSIGDRLSELFAHRQDAAAHAAGDAAMVATAIARKMVPEFYRRNAAGEIEHAVATILDRMLEKPTLTVRTSELLCDELSERIAALTEQRGFAGQVTVTADPKMGEGDCRVEWAGGGAELNSAARWREIDEIIEQNLGGVQAADTDVSDLSETSEAPAVNTTAESGGRDSSHQELEDDHG